MTLLVWAILLLVAPLALFQTVYVCLYARSFRKPKRNDSTTAAETSTLESQQPVAIVLCMRGGDPSLERCINALQNQSHSNFTIHCVFDNRSDPAVEIAQRCLEGRGELHFFAPDENAGSLKCQALTHTLQHLDDDTKFVALVDADAVVSQDWLRTLVRPFTDPNVVASTGNRWFETRPGLGSHLRRIWNAAAIVQMQLYNIPWGGSLAIRAHIARNETLISRWRNAFCEDTSLKAYLRETSAGNLVRVPELIVSNDETTQLSSAIRWITRQLLTTRLYDKHWPLVLLHAISVGTALMGCVVALAGTIFFGTVAEALWIACLFFSYQIVNALLIQWIASINNRFVTDHRRASDGVCEGQTNKLTNISILFTHLVATVLAQVVQPLAAIRAHLLNVVEWRGVEYHVSRNSQSPQPKIEMTKYRPFRTTHEPNSID